MAPAPAPRRSARARHPPPQPANHAMAPTSAPRRSARVRRPPPQPADQALAATPARRRSARARRPLPQPADRAAASTSARRRSAARGPASQTVLPDEIWEDIFLRLDAMADLARASAACSSFRSIISERAFLRRLRSLRSPAVLGFIHSGELYAPVDPPHRSAPEARALEQAADFTFSFIPSPWANRGVIYARDGRILLAMGISGVSGLHDYVVCDPLYRRYVKIPRIPDDLLDSEVFNGSSRLRDVPILAPGVENDDEESFRIICTVQLRNKFVVLIFSSCNQKWQGIIHTVCVPSFVDTHRTYYAHGCVHRVSLNMGALLMFDTSEMEFSIIDLPPTGNHKYHEYGGIVEAEEGRFGFLTISDVTIDLYCVGEQEWQHKKPIPLPKHSGINYDDWQIVGKAGRYVGLLASCEMLNKYFVLDIKTWIVEELCTLKNGVVFEGIPYARFPPPLALPSI